jgi:translation initiation factor 2 beta subunit (eIF-2beta)/eIF-5
VITAIEIVQEQREAKNTLYRAIRGDRQAMGTTPGQVLDTLERILAVQGSEDGDSMLVIVQRFRPDVFFPAEQWTRLQELMNRFHDACNTGQHLLPEEKQELERLVKEEWQAAMDRSEAILEQIRHSTA